jgi:ABC-2 type transport system permease protein
MKTLLAIEWLKIKRYRTFWILVGFFIVLLPLWNYQVQSGMLKIGGPGMNLLSQAYSFPAVWGNIGFWGSIFVVFLSILVIILTTNEFNFRTHRQNIIDGWNRQQFYHAKVWLVLLFSVLATVYVWLIGMLFGLVSGGADSMFLEIEKLGYFFLLSVNYLGLALLIGILVRRSGLAIGLFMLYCLIIENILEGMLNWSFDFDIGNYLPLQASDELLPFPVFGMVKTMISTPQPPIQYYVIATVAWCAVYYFIGRRRILRSDW